MYSKFGLGDRIRAVKDGVTGYVYGINHPSLQMYHFIKMEYEPNTWNNEFSNWQKYPVISIKLDEPNYPYDFETFRAACIDKRYYIGASEEELKILYKHTVKKQTFVSLPEEGFELIQEAVSDIEE